VVAAYAAALRRYGIFDYVDEGLLLVQAWRTAHGQVPYVDFHTGYGPLYFRLQAWLLSAGGWDAIRWALVAVHGAAGALLLVLARRLAGPALAWVAVALEVAFFLPVAPGRGAPFNVPYPAWYAGLAGVALAVLLGGGSAARPWRAAAAGAIAGVVAAMKPNSGLILAAGGGVAVVLAAPREGGGWVARAVLGLVALGAAGLVAPTGFTIAAWVLVPPVVALAALGRRRGVADADALRRLVPLLAGFVAVAGSAFAPALAALGLGGLTREIGAGVAALYALPFPWPAGVAAVVGLATFAARGRGARGLGVAALALAVAAGAAGAGAPLPALRLGAEQAAWALVPLALWSALAELRRDGDAVLLAPSVLAVMAALQLYPRPDFVHLLPLGVLVLPLALRAWARLPLPAYVLVGLPLIVAAVRAAPTALVLGRLASGRVTHVALGASDLVIDPAGAGPLEAIARAAAAVRGLAPEESVLAFPACGIVLFVAQRSPAGPHDYFFPGRPDRAEVDALVTRLAAAPPAVAVTCAATGTALADAWGHYPALVALLTSRYHEVVAAPPFTVRARDRPPPPQGSSPGTMDMISGSVRFGITPLV